MTAQTQSSIFTGRLWRNRCAVLPKRLAKDGFSPWWSTMPSTALSRGRARCSARTDAAAAGRGRPRATSRMPPAVRACFDFRLKPPFGGGRTWLINNAGIMEPGDHR